MLYSLIFCIYILFLNYLIAGIDLQSANVTLGSGGTSGNKTYPLPLLFELYEGCLIRMDENQFNYNFKLYEQPYCLNKTGLNTSINMFSFKTIENMISKNSYLLTLPQVCSIGKTVWTKRSVEIQVNASRAGCKPRGFFDRRSFRENWNTPQYEKSAISLLNTLASLPIRKITLFGDSVNSQLNQFLICDALREGAKVLNGRGEFPTDEKGFGRKNLEVNGKLILLIKIRGSLLYATEDQSIPDFFEVNYNSTLRTLKQLGNNVRESKPQVLVVNYGLHSTSIAPAAAVAKALLDYMKLYPYMYLLFRETTAQHFYNSPDGLYRHRNASLHSHEKLCCQLPEYPVANFYIDLALAEELHKLDVNWRNHIGWISLYNETLQLHDMHTEHVSDDCTHFMYAPRVFEGLWHNMKTEVQRLANLRKTFSI